MSLYVVIIVGGLSGDGIDKGCDHGVYTVIRWRRWMLRGIWQCFLCAMAMFLEDEMCYFKMKTVWS